VYDHRQDVVAAYDYLVSIVDVNPTRMGVCGASYGAYLAALITATRVVKRLILRAPALARDIEFPGLQRQPNDCEAIPEGFDSIEILRRYSGAVLILECERDEVIPKSHITAYLAACAHAEPRPIVGAPHALPANSRWDHLFVDAINDWFEQL
jgi:dienelactone hydrolase